MEVEEEVGGELEEEVEEAPGPEPGRLSAGLSSRVSESVYAVMTASTKAIHLLRSRRCSSRCSFAGSCVVGGAGAGGADAPGDDLLGGVRAGEAAKSGEACGLIHSRTARPCWARRRIRPASVKGTGSDS